MIPLPHRIPAQTHPLLGSRNQHHLPAMPCLQSARLGMHASQPALGVWRPMNATAAESSSVMVHVHVSLMRIRTAWVDSARPFDLQPLRHTLQSS